MSDKARIQLLQAFLEQCKEIEIKEKEFKDSASQNMYTDREFRTILISHFAYLEGRLSHVLEIAEAILKIEGKNTKETEELKTSLHNAVTKLRESTLAQEPINLQLNCLSEVIVIRNKIFGELGFQLAFGEFYSENVNPLFDILSLTEFLNIDINWMLSTIALQLQEVAIRKVSDKMGIELDRRNIEKILETPIDLGNLKFMPFNMQYKAFSKVVKQEKKMDMPRLVQDMRNTRTNVLHLGYNPTQEETETIITFTQGFLEKLRKIV